MMMETIQITKAAMKIEMELLGDGIELIVYLQIQFDILILLMESELKVLKIEMMVMILMEMDVLFLGILNTSGVDQMI